MIHREKNILFPMALRTLTDEWMKIAQQSEKIGYCLTEQSAEWQPERSHINVESDWKKGLIQFPTGVLNVKQIESTFNHLPVMY